MDTSILSHVSLCSGYGGIDLGLRRVLGKGLRTVAYSEIEASAVECLVARMEDGAIDPAPIWTDLKTFPWLRFHGLVDILSGGYPCQPFSAAGLRGGGEDQRHLWPWIADGIDSMHPSLCFFENVEGHITLGLRDVLNDLGKLGYRATWGIFSAAEVGAPHQRKRVFILAHSKRKRVQGSAFILGIARKIGQGRTGFEEDCDVDRWPSRPGEPQRNWEPARTIESKVGGNPDGSASRLGDELRLLGNGVVPATAALAFKTLLKELI